MKLLSRSQASSEANKNRKAQIDDGVIIASRIDALRKTLAELETQHVKYMSHISEEGRNMMEGLATGISRLKKEIVGLEAERDRLRIPLDAEWVEVKNQKKIAEETVVKSKEVHSVILLEKDRQQSFTKKIKESLEKSRVRERALKVALVEASEDRAVAFTLRQKVENDEIKQQRSFAQREKELDEKERVIDQTSVALESQRARQDSRELEQTEREREINDKYATLQRTLKRQK